LRNGQQHIYRDRENELPVAQIFFAMAMTVSDVFGVGVVSCHYEPFLCKLSPNYNRLKIRDFQKSSMAIDKKALQANKNHRKPEDGCRQTGARHF